MKIGKREIQRLAKRSQIIAVAREHFFEHGYDATTMSAIAAQLGGSKRTLWSHFRSKEELFAAMVEDTAAAIRSQIDMPDGDGDPVESLTRLARSIIERALSPLVIAMFRLVGPMADRRPEIGRIFLERGPGETQRVIGEYLRDRFADLLWTDDYHSAGIDLMAIAASGMHFQRMWGLTAQPSAEEREMQARRAALLFLRAYAKDPDKLVTRERFAAARVEQAVRHG